MEIKHAIREKRPGIEKNEKKKRGEEWRNWI